MILLNSCSGPRRQQCDHHHSQVSGPLFTGRKWRRQERSRFFLESACPFSHHDNTESANHATSTWPRNKLTNMSLRIWGQDYSCCASELGSQFTAILVRSLCVDKKSLSSQEKVRGILAIVKNHHQDLLKLIPVD